LHKAELGTLFKNSSLFKIIIKLLNHSIVDVKTKTFAMAYDSPFNVSMPQNEGVDGDG
jgi:hypothetical protein